MSQAKDKHHVYRGKQIIRDADAATFKLFEGKLGESGYARDKNHVFRFGQILKDKNPATFEYTEKIRSSIKTIILYVKYGLGK